ncbi:serine hydrolase domain-containing protein [Streptomyces sp. Li-HN-5-11]|uniref:serine hydrolase domain-containing protein n=1 Tax=Streptomyces sp. Li-HN-5-11 TaxID=3075432 RepID=UPI0028AC1243|nr:serine hydrolase domain-containing protein [Streptomyces sp. Li-HN-5-11]WNM32195.1 serine hydrolase domain-containing protein [Streptomyces sp. Li-HN-5-11]WOP39040.1 serine hydrolase domain-containing protein [Streptomyces sp. Li-HN-5-13]
MAQEQQLSGFVEATAREFGIPGLAVGVLADDREIHACHGVTSVDTPLPVDDRTLFHVASVTKTFTATALMRLAAQGRVDLAAPVRRYVPELRLADEDAAARVTVENLLNHTAGLEWNLIDTEGQDGSLAAFVAKMAGLGMIAPPGTRASYSQAGYNLAGRVVEAVTGLGFEKAVAALVLEPLGLSNTFFDLDEVMIRKFAVGHRRDDDGTLRPARPWRAFPAGARGNNPGGGIVSSVGDLLRWARFHLGTGEGVLPAAALERMKRQTVALRGSTLGDAFGICWFLREVDGVRTIGHGGSGNGQFAELLIVPERNFAVVCLANAGPEGYPANQAVVRWTLEHYLGLADRDPEPVPYDRARALEVAGRYEIDAMNLDIAAGGDRLTLAVGIKPEIRAASDTDMPPDYAAAAIGFLPGDGDEYIVTEGGLKGQRGFFSRDANGTVVGVDLAGRLFGRGA